MRLFLNPDEKYEAWDTLQEWYLYTTEDLVTFVDQSMQNYYNLANLTLEHYEYPMTNGSIDNPVTLFYTFDGQTQSTVYKEFYMNQSQIYPYSVGSLELKQIVQNSQKAEIRYMIYNILPKSSITTRSCYKWEIIQNLDFSEWSLIAVRLETHWFHCGFPYSTTIIQ